MKKLLLILIAALLPVQEAFCCTTVIVSAKASATGRPMMYKQRDADPEYNEMHYFTGNGYSYTGLINTGKTASVYGGINEKGFAIMNNLSYNLVPKGVDHDPQNGKVMKGALERCASIEDFVAYIDTARFWGCSANFGVIDAHGGAAYFEVWDSLVVRYDVPDGGYLYRTNFSFAGRHTTGGGQSRYDAATVALKAHKGKFTREWLFENIGRSFYYRGEDLLDRDCSLYDLPDSSIARTCSVAGLLIEGVGSKDKENSGVVWTAPGYVPCCYAVPVWVASGELLPPFQNATNELSVDLKKKLSTVELRDKVMPKVKAAEEIELKKAGKLHRRFARCGYKEDKLKQYYKEAQTRYELYTVDIAR